MNPWFDIPMDTLADIGKIFPKIEDGTFLFDILDHVFLFKHNFVLFCKSSNRQQFSSISNCFVSIKERQRSNMTARGV